ncbi:MAG: HlyD family secretion protein [Bacillota bacterium]|jgi:HlyD family secretion protein
MWINTNKRWTAVLVLPVLLFSLICSCGCAKTESTIGGFDPEKGLVVKGYIENKEIDLNTKMAGKIAKIHVEEGQTVKAGDLIAEIDNSQLLAKKAQVEAQVKMAREAVELQRKISKANVEQASGAYKAAQAQLEKAQAGARSQELEQAKANYEMMQKTYERVKNLYEKGAVTIQKKDEVETQLKVAEEQYSIAKEGARKQDIEAAQGMVNQARGALNAANAGWMQVQIAEQKYREALAGLDEVKSLIADTRITAPQNGTITALNCEAGELVSTGMPIATIADLKNLTVKLNVYESDLPKIKLGQNVQVRFAGTGDKIFQGEVKKISSKPHFATQRASNNKEEDVLSYEVKVKINLQNEERIYPGMTSFVQFASKK